MHDLSKLIFLDKWLHYLGQELSDESQHALRQSASIVGKLSPGVSGTLLWLLQLEPPGVGTMESAKCP